MNHFKTLLEKATPRPWKMDEVEYNLGIESVGNDQAPTNILLALYAVNSIEPLIRAADAIVSHLDRNTEEVIFVDVMSDMIASYRSARKALDESAGAK